MSIDNLSEAELSAQLESEIQALNGGINQSNEGTQQEEFQDTETQEEDYQEKESNENDNQQEEFQDTETQKEEEYESETKTERKIKKLLSQRNLEKKEKQELASRLEEVENKLADTDFYKENKDALEFKDDITKLVNDRGFTREEAYIQIAGRKILDNNKKLSSNKTTMVGNTPGSNRNGVNPNTMALADLDSLVKNMYSAGKINI